MLLVVLTLVLVSIPLTVYLALTGQLIFKRAAASATITFSPSVIVTDPNQQVLVDVFVNSGDYGLTGTALDLHFDTAAFALKQVQPKGPYVYVGDDPATTTVTKFSLVLGQGEQNRPTQHVHVAALKFQLLGNKTGTLQIKKSTSRINGYDMASQQAVALEIAGGPVLTYASKSSLCRISACPAASSMNLTPIIPVIVNGTKYHIEVAWTKPQTNDNPVYYRLYRAIGNPVPTDHPEQNSIGYAGETKFIDTNGTTGFSPNQKVYYDIDMYQACPNP